MKYDFDIIVVGGGAGGLFAASVANALGAKTCLIDKKRLGGDCTWFGCMPSKALLKSASIAKNFENYSDFGIKINGELSLDYSKVMGHVKDVVKEISTHHPPEVFEKRGITVILKPPRFLDTSTIEVDGKKIKAKKFIICTGSHPVVPPIEGLSNIDYLTNENIFDLEILPKSLIVLGGGPIGVELSQALNRIGVKVHIVEMLDRILFREDKDMAKVLEDKLKDEGLDIIAGKRAIKFEKINDEIRVTVEDKSGKEIITAERVLVAVGRAPNLKGLDLEKAGVEYTKKGIKINSYLQATNKNVFACGDIVGPYQFSHVAAYQASVVVRNALFNRLAWQKASYQNVAWATFTDPELAHLGLGEEEARTKYKHINVYKNEYTSSDRAITDLEKNGLVKVITDKKGYIVGACVVGAKASEIIHSLVVAKSLKIPLHKIAPVLFIYPTLSELIKKTAAKPLIDKMGNPFIKFIINVMKNI